MAIGVITLGIGVNTGQNSAFLIGCGAFFGIGVISLLNALGIISGVLNKVLMVVLILGAVGLASLDYKSIKDPVDFMNEKDRRYAYVIQGLKNIRTAEIAYKAARGTYTNSYDSLLNFIKTDSFKVVKAIGMVPDTLTEAQALEMGLVSRDTIPFSVQDSIFGQRYQTDDYHGKFILDSLPYVPFGGGAKYKLETGEIERGSVSVPVFEATDSKPFDKKQVLKVGSLSDPSTSGNWE